MDVMSILEQKKLLVPIELLLGLKHANRIIIVAFINSRYTAKFLMVIYKFGAVRYDDIF